MNARVTDGKDHGDGRDDFSQRLAEHFSEELTDDQLDEFERRYGKFQTTDNPSRWNRFQELVEQGGN